MAPAEVDTLDYHRVAQAITYLRAQAPRQPSLAEVAATVHLSPDHFQRMFTAWAGLSPKQFARTLTLEYAKRILGQPAAPSLFQAAQTLGLSSPSRLHDAFVRLEALTPGEWRTQASGLQVEYAFAKTRFGEAVVASTARGICALRFVDTEEAAVADLHRKLPNATLVQTAPNALHQQALDVLAGVAAQPKQPLALHLRGTRFQVQVWRALLRIPVGAATSYGELATTLGNPTAARAIGSAVGANPVAWLIPCHRVLRGDGQLGGYAWGLDRKVAMIGVEASAVDC